MSTNYSLQRIQATIFNIRVLPNGANRLGRYPFSRTSAPVSQNALNAFRNFEFCFLNRNGATAPITRIQNVLNV